MTTASLDQPTHRLPVVYVDSGRHYADQWTLDTYWGPRHLLAARLQLSRRNRTRRSAVRAAKRLAGA